MVLNVEFTKKLQDGHRFSVKAKSPAGINLCDWFYKFIDDYNIKYPKDPIEIRNEKQDFYTWIFYAKRSFFHRRKYLDFERTIKENKITEKMNIICKRVIEQQEEKVISIEKGMFNI